MEELALEAEVVGDAVDGVAADGKPDRLEMDADLVRPAGLEPDVEERVVAHRLLDVEPRHRLARGRRVERVPRAVAAVAADRRLDPPRRRLRLAPHERRVGALELARANQLLQQLVRLLRAGDDEQARGVAIEPVDDPGPVVVVPTLGSVGEQPLDERARARRSGRMDDEAGRLVDDEQVLVLPDDRDVELLRLQLDRLGDLDVDLLPALEPEALRPRLAVDEHRARRDQALGERARVELGPHGENAIEPRPGVVLRNAKAEPCQGAGSSGRTPRTRRTAARRPRR